MSEPNPSPKKDLKTIKAEKTAALNKAVAAEKKQKQDAAAQAVKDNTSEGRKARQAEARKKHEKNPPSESRLARQGRAEENQ